MSRKSCTWMACIKHVIAWAHVSMTYMCMWKLRGRIPVCLHMKHNGSHRTPFIVHKICRRQPYWRRNPTNDCPNTNMIHVAGKPAGLCTVTCTCTSNQTRIVKIRYPNLNHPHRSRQQTEQRNSDHNVHSHLFCHVMNLQWRAKVSKHVDVTIQWHQGWWVS